MGCVGEQSSWPELVHASGIKATGAQDRAIVIAVDDYAFVPDVVGAEDSAKDWIRFLRSDLGITTVTSLLLSGSENLSLTQEACEQFFEEGSPRTHL